MTLDGVSHLLSRTNIFKFGGAKPLSLHEASSLSVFVVFLLSCLVGMNDFSFEPYLANIRTTFALGN